MDIVAYRIIWLTFCCTLAGHLLLALPEVSAADVAADDDLHLGSHHYRTCREDNVTFMWSKPDNLTGFLFMDLIFIPRNPSNDSNNRDMIMSVTADGSSTIHSRYVGRLFFSNGPDDYRFKLITVNPKDRGSYEMIMISKEQKEYRGYAELTVYAEDNLWPIGDDEDHVAEAQMDEVPEQPNHYLYRFKKHEESPVIGMMMSVKNSKVKNSCYFGNGSRCEIMITRMDLEGLTGTIRFDVTPLMENDSLKCHAVKQTYVYQISIMTAKLSSALKAGICISVFITLAVVIITPISIHVKNKREKYIPLKGGYSFIRGCVDRIEETPELSDVYRKNANSKMIHPHVKSYFQDPKASEGFFQDEGLTKIYFAAFIKYYITNVCEPLIPIEYIHKVKNGEKDETTDVSEIKDVMLVKKKEKSTD